MSQPVPFFMEVTYDRYRETTKPKKENTEKAFRIRQVLYLLIRLSNPFYYCDDRGADSNRSNARYADNVFLRFIWRRITTMCHD